MQTLTNNYDGLSLVARLNLDRVLFLGMLVPGLWAGSWLAAAAGFSG